MPDFNSFREITRSVTVSYPIPFLFATLLAFALGCFWIGLRATEPLTWIVDGLGTAATLVSVGLALYGVLVKPELLRSERYTLMQGALDIIGNDEMTTEDRKVLLLALK